MNAYLFCFKRRESAQCPACGVDKETPQHFLLECPAYAHERRKIGLKKGELELKFADIFSNGRKIISLAHYIKDTSRFIENEQEPKSIGDVGQAKAHAS